MKKTALSLTLVTALLISALAGSQLSSLTKANYFPFEPNNPIIIIESPTNSTYNVNSITLNVTIKTMKTLFEGTDPAQSMTRLVTYSLDGESSGIITETSYSYNNSFWAAGSNVTFIGSAVLPELTDGPHNITVHAEYDYNPYDIHRESQSSVYFRIDTTSPDISILSPSDEAYITSNNPFIFTVSEPVLWMSYSLDGQANETLTANMTLSWMMSGMHSLVIYACDKAGNIGVSKTTNFSIDAVTVEWIEIILTVIVVVSVGSMVYFRKRKH